jgi:tight adherence protein B
MLLLIVILVFLTIFLLVIFLSGGFFKPRVDVKKRMERYITSLTADVTSDNLIKSDHNEPTGGELTRKFKEIIDKYGKKIEVKGYTKQIEIELQKGDIPLRGYEFIFLIFGIAIGFVVIIFLWNHNPVSMMVAALIGITGPIIYLRFKQQKKAAKFNNQIGDALVMVSNSLKAGYGFLQAVDMVAKEMAPPIQTEFARTIQEINLGVTTEDALIRLTQRVPSPDLDLVITAMLIQRQIGGNLSEILDNISQTIRERIRIKSEVKALTAQGRLSGLIIGIMPIGIGAFLLLVNPKYMMQLFTDPRGQFMLGYAAIAELIAVLIIRKIINIKV